jgi:uncharacterized protein YrrD
MLLLGSRLNETPVMSLQTGGRLGATTRPIIDPATLYIYAYEVSGPLLTQQPSFLRTADIREFGRLGMIIDSNDEIVGLGEVLKIDELYKLGFPLIGMQVSDEHSRKLGKVTDYTVDTSTFTVQQLSVGKSFFRGLNDTGSLIHRSQIVEINDKAIIVKSGAKRVVEPVMEALRGEFVNPFRKPAQTAGPDTRSNE